MNYWIIERIKENYAVIQHDESGQIQHIPLNQLPAPCYEGMVLADQDGRFLHAPAYEQERREQLQARLNRLLGCTE